VRFFQPPWTSTPKSPSSWGLRGRRRRARPRSRGVRRRGTRPRSTAPEEVVEPVSDQDQVVSGFLHSANARWQWCQCRNCSSAKKIRKPSATQPNVVIGRHAEERRRDHVEQRAADERPRGEGDERQENLLERRFAQDQGHAPDQRDRAHQDPPSRIHHLGLYVEVLLDEPFECLGRRRLVREDPGHGFPLSVAVHGCSPLHALSI
jgi:hypothetical protein